MAALGLALQLLAAAVLLSSLFVGWYQFRYVGVSPASGGSNSASFGGSSTFFPGSEFQSSSSCSGNPQLCAASGNRNQTQDHPYDNPGTVVDAYPATGRLYEFLEIDLLVAAGLAVAGAGLRWASSRGKAVPRRALSLVIGLGIACAAAAPFGVWIVNPLVTHADYVADAHGMATNFTGPGGSFWGSCSSMSCGSGGGIMDSWGPAAGWYEGWIALALSATGGSLLWRSWGSSAAEDSSGTAVDPERPRTNGTTGGAAP